ncbi:hypothetical protein WN51_14449, partial [Melipona quadrifasciata]
DNDPKHVCKVSKKYYNENNIHLLPWPAQSPDLNIGTILIEMCLSIVEIINNYFKEHY